MSPGSAQHGTVGPRTTAHSRKSFRRRVDQSNCRRERNSVSDLIKTATKKGNAKWTRSRRPKPSGIGAQRGGHRKSNRMKTRHRLKNRSDGTRRFRCPSQVVQSELRSCDGSIMSNKKPTPLFPQKQLQRCPECGEISYSRAGIHPQCAVLREDAKRMHRIRSWRQASEAIEQDSDV